MTDTATTVLFVDVLGFGALVEENPTVPLILGPVFQPYSDSTKRIAEAITGGLTNPLLRTFVGFHSVLEEHVRRHAANGITAITFSDSAFLTLEHPDQVFELAGALMRAFISRRVPVRMGLGYGTFAALRFMSDSTPHAHVHASQFCGTAVTRAYAAAEKSRIEGLQIILHPSMETHVGNIFGRPVALGLSQTNVHSQFELVYLTVPPPGPFTDQEQDDLVRATVRECDVLSADVAAMKDSAPESKKHYYLNAEAALVRMKVAINDYVVKNRA